MAGLDVHPDTPKHTPTLRVGAPTYHTIPPPWAGADNQAPASPIRRVWPLSSLIRRASLCFALYSLVSPPLAAVTRRIAALSGATVPNTPIVCRDRAAVRRNVVLP